ncbi:MAG: ABC transporter substrate-binding protein, partial [Saprospiraceae bacterium]|nr:ABC transporter substrate-binding protein [Saprospiraceae bacterium]
VLSDVLVRRALTHLVDVELLCNELFYGLAQPATGPIHPNSDYYRSGYKPISFDPEKSITLLNESGWQDSNNNGIRDKVINGKLTELAFGIKITRSQLSQDVAILLKSQAAEVGIEIEILPQDFSVTLTQIRNRDYELAALSSIQSPSLYDPYPTWHSHNANPTGSNYCHFMDVEADEIIETLRQSVSDSTTIRRLYNDFQQIIYERQPAIFLVSPTINLALRTNLKLESLKIRPGYYENLVVFD